MSNNPYKDFYKAVNSGDEWAGVRVNEAKKRIEKSKYASSWTGEEPNFNEEYNFGGS